ncbi:uncharacterized protein LOC110992597 [Pieris rapae]|uniref:uncharacterized protein LOC110992597 n=1 Tax=Pieris rapae TaxID=64459 RepID=UPI000B92DD4F|nr:uncharacterized protein LOC110992597 [Pieris rapae]
MFNKNYCFVFLSAYLAFSDAAFVDTLMKCQPEDWDCLKKVIKGVLEGIADTGIPEYDIPPIDPLKLTNLKLNFLDMAELTIKEGVVKGLKSCEITDAKLHMDKGTGLLKLVCDITAKGKYEVTGSGPALKDLFGPGALKGNGNAKLKIEKMLITYKMKFDVVKRDGKIYLTCEKDLAKYDFDLQGPSHLTLDHLYIGDVDSSKLIMDYYNQNYKTVWETFGKSTLVSATDIAYEMLYKFFGNVEAEKYLAGDLSKYVKN